MSQSPLLRKQQPQSEEGMDQDMWEESEREGRDEVLPNFVRKFQSQLIQRQEETEEDEAEEEEEEEEEGGGGREEEKEEKEEEEKEMVLEDEEDEDEEGGEEEEEEEEKEMVLEDEEDEDEEEEEEEVPIVEDEVKGKNGKEDSRADLLWVCSRCTLVNVFKDTHCEACGQEKPRAEVPLSGRVRR